LLPNCRTGAHPFFQRLEGNFLRAIIVKKQVSLLSAYTLALLTAFGFFFGFLGSIFSAANSNCYSTWVKEVLIKDILDRWQTAASVKLFYCSP